MTLFSIRIVLELRVKSWVGRLATRYGPFLTHTGFSLRCIYCQKHSVIGLCSVFRLLCVSQAL